MSARSAFPQREEAWLELARRAARDGLSREQAPNAQRLLVFTLDGAPYALAVERVREIVRRRPITPVPRLPAEVLGVISLRGRILQVIDPRARLALAPGEPGARSRIVVAHDGEGRVAGILVDSVEEVVTVAEEGMCEPRVGQGSAVEGIYRHRGRFVSIVDLDRVMDVDAGA
jgi:chemotaxis signal transduction protein